MSGVCVNQKKGRWNTHQENRHNDETNSMKASISLPPSKDANQSVLVFSLTVIKGIINNPTLNCPIEYLEEEELRGKTPKNSIKINSLIHLCSTRPVFDSHFFQVPISIEHYMLFIIYDQQLYNLHSQVPITH